MITNSQHSLIPQHTTRPYRCIPVADRLWLFTLCLANGLPYAFIFVLLIMFKRMGLNNTTVTFNISCVMLPLVARPLVHYIFHKIGWSKEVWLLATELTVTVSLLLMAEALESDYWFQYTTLLLLVVTVASVIHNVASESQYKAITATSYPVMLRPMFVVYHGIAFLLGLGVLVMVAGNVEVLTRNIQHAWSTALRAGAAMYALLWLFHLVKVWKSTDEGYAVKDETNDISTWREMTGVLRLFFGKKSVSVGAIYFLFYLLPQGFTLAVLPLFLIDSSQRGGMGLSPQEYAFTAGTVGVMGLCVGSLACAVFLRHHRSPKTLVPLSFANMLPALSGLVMSHMIHCSLFVLNCCMFVGHAGLGMSVTACCGFLSYYSCGRYKGTFYSIGIGLMFLSCIFSCIYSGTLQRYYGYPVYFAYTWMLSSISIIISVILKRICFRNK